MIQARNELSTGIELHVPDTKSKIKHHGVTFVDDRTGHVAGNPDEDNTTKFMLNCVRKCTKKCTSVVQSDTALNGGLMALHKTNWQPIAWEVVNGVLTMMHATEHTIMVKDGKGAYAKIDFIPSSEGVKRLGYRLSPSANQKPHHEATLKAVQ